MGLIPEPFLLCILPMTNLFHGPGFKCHPLADDSWIFMPREAADRGQQEATQVSVCKSHRSYRHAASQVISQANTGGVQSPLLLMNGVALMVTGVTGTLITGSPQLSPYHLGHLPPEQEPSS